MWFALLIMMGCVERPEMVCTREFAPVCARSVQYANLCSAQSAGYYGDCAHEITTGPCGSTTTPGVRDFVACADDETMSEYMGSCVKKPWNDYVSCQIEKEQGACEDGRDPNQWVIRHCKHTCTGG